MKEYFTEAFILDIQEKGEFDSLITLYTRDFGKIMAKAKSIKKIVSKSAGHLQPLNFANVRLIEKNGFQVIDALTSESCAKLKINSDSFAKFLNIAKFIKDATFEHHCDYRFWLAIKKIMELDIIKDEMIIYRWLLKILGFDSEFADCVVCKSKEIKFFLKNDHCFICQKCAFKAPKDEVVLIS
ncbi:MAG: DNA repair protein RecO [Patescibacteria group bacterium]